MISRPWHFFLSQLSRQLCGSKSPASVHSSADSLVLYAFASCNQASLLSGGLLQTFWEPGKYEALLDITHCPVLSTPDSTDMD